MTAELSWHVQNCDLIGWLWSKLKQREFPKEFNHELLSYMCNIPLIPWYNLAEVSSYEFHSNQVKFKLLVSDIPRSSAATTVIEKDWQLLVSPEGHFNCEYISAFLQDISTHWGSIHPIKFDITIFWIKNCEVCLSLTWWSLKISTEVWRVNICLGYVNCNWRSLRLWRR